jgi:hypothetical protein
MPLPKGTKYRYKTTAQGKIRLAFGPGGKVIETKKAGEAAKKIR